jgi:chemotaxis-related protein WspB
MLFLSFQLNQDTYALAADTVIEVLPCVDLKVIPLAPTGTAGLLNYRGQSVPVIDLCQLCLGRPALAVYSTRIVITRYRAEHCLGLLVEKALDTLRGSPSEFQESGLSPAGAPYLGPVLERDGRFIQWIQVDQLLTEAVRTALFTVPARND